MYDWQGYIQPRLRTRALPEHAALPPGTPLPTPSLQPIMTSIQCPDCYSVARSSAMYVGFTALLSLAMSFMGRAG